MVQIKDLAEEYNMPPKVIRSTLRKAGLRAPAVNDEEAKKFGPKMKYEWKEGSKELKEVREILSAAFSPTLEDLEEGAEKGEK